MLCCGLLWLGEGRAWRLPSLLVCRHQPQHCLGLRVPRCVDANSAGGKLPVQRAELSPDHLCPIVPVHVVFKRVGPEKVDPAHESSVVLRGHLDHWPRLHSRATSASAGGRGLCSLCCLWLGGGPGPGRPGDLLHPPLDVPEAERRTSVQDLTSACNLQQLQRFPLVSAAKLHSSPRGSGRGALEGRDQLHGSDGVPHGIPVPPQLPVGRGPP
mmetsp:Transcript_20608/g.64888  ORF Transcript_20608/g.64888 Transcript_20608/m.64888 type:complete len:213 (+) Transcript_20608:290-928(+)